ncbi:hypothetical protein BSL82_10145 [Tardibacter chloracetimidivorans]|uniref:Bbp19-like phage domain-containing protein n=1 Tax=Tardibacter chloracetimidivorans TaxID=1921510 RepID=A0A1L3ZVI1_9SPHN|nr:hypothetical protein [Tardibacter chloracetimidivorans]API59633.1 hypothetical protein BSL82_10145 [Tardibacter chloracetimidivorans]
MSDFDPFDIQGQEQDDAARAARAELLASTEAGDVKWLMADLRGRRMVRRLLEQAGVFRSSFNGEALGTAFREGERNIGLRLLALVTEHAPERLVDVLTGKDQNG